MEKWKMPFLINTVAFNKKHETWGYEEEINKNPRKDVKPTLLHVIRLLEKQIPQD